MTTTTNHDEDRATWRHWAIALVALATLNIGLPLLVGTVAGAITGSN